VIARNSLSMENGHDDDDDDDNNNNGCLILKTISSITIAETVI
jgi:hypothetical protein